MVSPESLLLNPAGIKDTGNFQYIISSWATQLNYPKDILDRFEVVCIMHNKNPAPPEHEYLLIKTKDLTNEDTLFFVLEQTVSNEVTTPVTDINGPIIWKNWLC